MAHTIRFDARIGKSRKVEVTLPPDVPLGDAEVTLVVVPKKERVRARKEAATNEEFRPIQELIDTGAAGIWAGRKDIADGAEYARELRRRAWKRSA